MPILYNCMINRREHMVWEAFYALNQVSYRREVLQRVNQLEYYGIKEITLNRDAYLNMFYQHKGNYVLICVSENTDKSEMNSYLDSINVRVLKEINGDNGNLNTSDYEAQNSDVFQEPNAEEIYKKLGVEISKFLTDWNKDPNNRSKHA